MLVNELRARGVTALYTMETRDVVGSGIELPVSGVSSLVENLIALRYVERHARSRRLLSVVKVRGSGFDPTLREFVIEGGREHIGEQVSAAVPGRLIETTVKAAALFQTGKWPAGLVSAPAVALAEGVVGIMFMSRV